MRKEDFIQQLCYNNLPENYSGELKNLQNELGFLENSIKRAIISMRVDEYGHKWDEYESYTYKITPLQKIVIPVYKNRIKIHTQFNAKKALTRKNGETIDFKPVEKRKDWFIAEISEKVKEDEPLFYGLDEVSWERVQKSVQIDSNAVFRNEKDREFRPLRISKKGGKYILFFGKSSGFHGKELYVDGKQLEFEIRDGDYDFEKLWVYSEKDGRRTSKNIKFKRTSTSTVESVDQIWSRYVVDENENLFFFSLIPHNDEKKEKGVWIVLEEDEESETVEGRTKKDLFFELLKAASDFEVWEDSRIDYRKKEKRIRVLRLDTEEGRLLLERKPTVDKIYPPKNEYQLRMQKNAVTTLLHRPSPEHLPLLKIFMDREKVSFETPSRYRKKINWIFLRDEDREGTDEQRDFVEKALSTPEFTLLEGPPGSGKTTAITELIYQLLRQGKRVMLAASTHVAVDNVLEKLHEQFDGQPMQNGIVPLRIGREEAISEVIRDYEIERRKEVMEKVFDKEEFFKSSAEDEKKRYLEDAVVRSSNLICGTTIGILQYPPFRQKNKRGKYFEPEFDYLIIDEASKTTFQEFLVPAVNAKRWIIVGDVKQLSPYADTLQIRLLIDRTLGDSNMKTALTAIFDLMFNRGGASIDHKYYHPPNFIYVAPKMVVEKIAEVVKEKHDNRQRKNNEKVIPYAFVVSSDLQKRIERGHFFSAREMDSKVLSEIDISRGEYALPTLLSKEIIFAEDTVFRRYHRNFPYTHILIWHEERSKYHPHNYRHLYWYNYRLKHDGSEPYALRSLRSKYGASTEYDAIQKDIKEAFEKDWANELAWRLKRMQELEYEKSDEGSKKYYRASVFALMPPEPKEKGGYNPYYAIRKVRRLWMPSILKSLQEGISGDWDAKETKTSFSHGLPDDVKKKRFSALTYQHRMHPDISIIPRELFYDNRALQDDEFVRKTGRKWDYKRYRKRVVWVDIPHWLKGAGVYKNVNRAEGEAILRELEKFVEYDSKQEKKHTAIVLSFYEGQRKHIRDLLRKKYPENSKKQTRFTIKGVDVRVYTVDRVQGKEGDIVFLSMTQNRRVGFMDSPNRLNVAITRAKYQLVVVGDIEYFINQDKSPSLKNFARMVKENEVIQHEKRN